jgi:hypothetical protein
MTRTTAWRALAAVLTSSCVTLAPAVPAFAMVPAIQGPPIAKPPRGRFGSEGRPPAFWRKLAHRHPRVARFQMPAVKEIAPGSGGGSHVGAGAGGARQITTGSSGGRQVTTGSGGARQITTGSSGGRQVTTGSGGARQATTGSSGGRQITTGSGGRRHRAAERRHAREVRSPDHAGQGRPVALTDPRSLVGDPPSDRPSSSTARFATADLPATPLRRTAARGTSTDGLAGVIGGGIVSVIVVAFAGSQLRLRPGRGRARA